jgi:hypothetical protein
MAGNQQPQPWYNTLQYSLMNTAKQGDMLSKAPGLPLSVVAGMGIRKAERRCARLQFGQH